MPSPDQVTLNFTDKLQLGAMRLGIAFLRLLGFRGIRLLSNILGSLAWVAIPARRRYAVESVKRHLGVDESRARAIAAASFRNNFCSFIEAALVHNFPPYGNRNLIPPDKNFAALAQEQRPVVAVTAHIGGWELLAGIQDYVKQGAPRAIVVRNQKNRALNRLIFDMRSSSGGAVVGHRNAAPTLTKVLRQNGVTAFLVDHNALRSEAIFINFLGEQASVNIGPAMLALRGKAMVYPIFLIRRPGYVYEVITRQPLDSAALEGCIADRVRQIAEFYTKAVEEIVREYPEQWMWMHERWKTKPKA